MVPAIRGGNSMGKKILIVDDEKGIRELFAEVLHRAGHTVVTAGDGLAGIEVARGGDIDIAFLDIKMPGLNGVETLKEVRGTSPQTKVVMITGYARDELVNEALKMDVFACLAKPFSVRDVVDMVNLLSESA
jgi:DNA-binding NtrC family response regulator